MGFFLFGVAYSHFKRYHSCKNHFKLRIMPNNSPNTLFAAVDLGSNSFRLEIGRYDHGQMVRIDYLKEAVRQGGDLDENRNLSADAMERGLKCLLRFGERIKGFPATHVRAVATQTLREAKNREEFLRLAKVALGFDVEVISGVEEARLIYQGVSRFLPQSEERRLVVDIGGRSTEFILGQGFAIHSTDSLRVGSVAWSLKYFPKGQFTEEAFLRAEVAAESYLDAIMQTYQPAAWDVAYGASGTVGAIAEILGYAGFESDCINRKSLKWLRSELIRARHVDKLTMAGLKDDRKPVIGGGLSVLLAVFDLLEIEEMQVASGALRHGLLYGMAEQDRHEMLDLRKNAIERLSNRFGVDKAHANRIGEVANILFRQIVRYAPEASYAAHTQELIWAGQLHEIGGAISHTNAHRHSAYILNNAEIMGFAQHELHRLSQLVLGHKGKLTKLDINDEDAVFMTELLCLRLAVIFCHSRTMPRLDNIQLHADRNTFYLDIPSEWQKVHPQSTYLLEEEVLAWKKTSWSLIITHS